MEYIEQPGRKNSWQNIFPVLLVIALATSVIWPNTVGADEETIQAKGDERLSYDFSKKLQLKRQKLLEELTLEQREYYSKRLDPKVREEMVDRGRQQRRCRDNQRPRKKKR